jgi:integrase
MERRKRCQRPKYVPTELEVRALAEAAPDDRMWAFTLVAAFSGLRLFEVGALRVEDFDPAGSLVVRRGKGGYADEVSLLYEPGLGAIEDVLPESGLIWRTPRGNPWDRRFVWRLWGPMQERAGVPAACTFHALRHFHACWLLDKGAQMHDVGSQLRHHDNGELVRRLYGRQRSVDASLRRLDGLR